MSEFQKEDTPVDPLATPQSKADLDLLREQHEQLKIRFMALESRVASLEDSPRMRSWQKFLDHLRALIQEIDARPSLSDPSSPRSSGSRPPR